MRSGDSTRLRASDRPGAIRGAVEFGDVGAAAEGTGPAMRSRRRTGVQGRSAIDRSEDPAAEWDWRGLGRPVRANLKTHKTQRLALTFRSSRLGTRAIVARASRLSGHVSQTTRSRL